MNRAAPLPCQEAGGGDTGDDAGQETVLAGSALLYNPLTNRVTRCCFGPGREQTHCLPSFNHEPERVKQKSKLSQSQKGYDTCTDAATHLRK